MPLPIADGETGLSILNKINAAFVELANKMGIDMATPISATKALPIGADSLYVSDSAADGEIKEALISSLGPAMRNALAALTGADRLDASAIQNLPSGGGSALGLWDYWDYSRFGSNIGSAPDMFQGIGINSGTNTSPPPTSVGGRGRGYNSWGQLIRSSAVANSNSGWRCRTSSANHYFGGQASKGRFQFQLQTIAGVTLRWGYNMSTSVADSSDGCHMEVVNGVVSLKTSENSVPTVHGTTLLLAAETPYTADIETSLDGLTKRLRIYQELNAAAILDITLNNAQLTDGARRTGYGFTVTGDVAANTDLIVAYGMGIGTPAGFSRAMG